MVDVVVVGARVGGSVVATLLGEAGYRVVVVDATKFPSDTISTHFFRGAGLGSVLVRLGLLEQVLALGSPPLTTQYDFAGEDPQWTTEGPQDGGDLGYGLSVRRKPLDALLVERARSTPGVEVRQGTVVREVERDGGRVTGVVVESDGRREMIGARLVIGADGRSSRIARLVEATEEQHEPATRALYYRYVRGFRGPGGSWDGPEFSVVGDEMAYVFPSDDGIACIAVSINLETFEMFRRRPAEAFSERIARHPGLAHRFAAAEPIGDVLGRGPVDAVARIPAGPGWALVGDAGMHQDPWTGLGMDNAGVHATYLAEAVDDVLSGRTPEREAFATYHRRRNDHALAGWLDTARFGRDLSQMLG